MTSTSPSGRGSHVTVAIRSLSNERRNTNHEFGGRRRTSGFGACTHKKWDIVSADPKPSGSRGHSRWHVSSRTMTATPPRENGRVGKGVGGRPTFAGLCTPKKRSSAPPKRVADNRLPPVTSAIAHSARHQIIPRWRRRSCSAPLPRLWASRRGWSRCGRGRVDRNGSARRFGTYPDWRHRVATGVEDVERPSVERDSDVLLGLITTRAGMPPRISSTMTSSASSSLRRCSAGLSPILTAS
jgi:hypothetical protein